MEPDRAMGVVRISDEVELSTLEGEGDDPSVLLIHGLASNARMWLGVGEHLSTAGRRWRAVDLRGHGLSSRSDDGYDFETICSDLAVAARGLGPVIAVGQSWGGNVVVELASRYPHIIAGVVCVDGGFIKLSETFTTWADAESQLRPPDFTGMVRTSLEAMARERLNGWPEAGIDGQLANFEELPDGTIRSRLSWQRHRRILEALWEHDPDPVARTIAVPLLVIATNGDEQKRARVESFSRMASRSEVIWTDAHHDVHAQRPEQVAEWILGVKS